jgi:hypothetical protein
LLLLLLLSLRYVVGDLDRDIEATKALINKVFGSLPAAR